MGRPRTRRYDPLAPKSTQVSAFVSVSEAAMIKNAAEDLGVSVAKFVRDLVLPVAQKHHCETITQEEAP